MRQFTSQSIHHRRQDEHGERRPSEARLPGCEEADARGDVGHLVHHGEAREREEKARSRVLRGGYEIVGGA